MKSKSIRPISFTDYYLSEEYKNKVLYESKKGNYLIPLIEGLSQKVSKETCNKYWRQYEKL